MSDAYYAPHPRMRIEPALVLTGHPGSGVEAVARMLCARTGLVLNDVARSAESVAGASRAHIVVERGLARLWEFEEAALRKALRRRPVGVVVVPTALLQDDARRAWLLERARTVYVRRPMEVLLARIRRQVAAAPGSLSDFMLGVPGDVEALRAHLAVSERAVRDIGAIVEARDRHPAHVAGELLEALDRLVQVEPIGT